MKNISNLTCDVVIIGAGGSGLAAAVRAAEMRVKDIIVLEKNARPGGNAWLAVVMFGIKKGMNFSTDDAFKMTMAGGRWVISPKILHAYFEKCGEVTEWLEDKGMEFSTTNFDLNGKHFPILSMPKRKEGFKDIDPSIGPGFIGSSIVKVLNQECEKLGIRILTKTKADKILTNDEGQIIGVLASVKDKKLKINAKSVIVSTGGFGANEKMMRKYFPDFYKVEGRINRLCMGSSTGDGILMAEELGALVGENLEPGVLGPAHHPWSHSVHEALLRPECIWVNKNGERFVDEAVSMGAVHAMNRQPGEVLYALMDAETKKFYQDNPTERQKVMGVLNWLDHLDQDLLSTYFSFHCRIYFPWINTYNSVVHALPRISIKYHPPIIEECTFCINKYKVLITDREISLHHQVYLYAPCSKSNHIIRICCFLNICFLIQGMLRWL